MRKTYKQWLAAVLCLVCMWAMAPAGAGAEEEAYYPFALPGVLEVVQLNNVPPTAQVLTLWETFNRRGKRNPNVRCENVELSTNGVGTYPFTMTVSVAQSLLEAGTFTFTVDLWYDGLPESWARRSSEIDVIGHAVKGDSGYSVTWTYQDGNLYDKPEMRFRAEYDQSRGMERIMEVPYTVVVKQNGSQAPGPATFAIEAYNYSHPMGKTVPITGTVIETNGPGTYHGVLTVHTCEYEQNNNYLREFYVRQKMTSGSGNWSVSPAVFRIELPPYIDHLTVLRTNDMSAPFQFIHTYGGSGAGSGGTVPSSGTTSGGSAGGQTPADQPTGDQPAADPAAPETSTGDPVTAPDAPKDSAPDAATADIAQPKQQAQSRTVLWIGLAAAAAVAAGAAVWLLVRKKRK